MYKERWILKEFLDEINDHVENVRGTLAVLQERDAQKVPLMVLDELCAVGMELGAAANKVDGLMKKVSRIRRGEEPFA